MNAQIYWNAACMYGSIPAYYNTYIVQVRGHARLRWVKMRCDEGRSVDGWQLGPAISCSLGGIVGWTERGREGRVTAGPAPPWLEMVTAEHMHTTLPP